MGCFDVIMDASISVTRLSPNGMEEREKMIHLQQMKAEAEQGPTSATVAPYSYGWHTAASLPPSPTVSGEFPVSRGIKPEIGPPLAAAAGVSSVAFAPVLSVCCTAGVQFNGVIP
jgi:hypothetical protein